MHQQIKASPDTVAENVQQILDALAERDINIEAMAPDFDPPHVRVLVKHENMDAALSALRDAGLGPEPRSAITLTIKNQPAALKRAMDKLAQKGLTVESVLTLPEPDAPETAKISFGVSRTEIKDWDQEVDTLVSEIESELNQP